MDKKYALALAGGGTRGAYQTGAWKAISEIGLEIEAIAGTSIGAINGAMFTQGDSNLLEQLYMEIKPDQIIESPPNLDYSKDIFHPINIFRLSSDFIKHRGYLNTPLRKLLEEYLNPDKIYDSPIDYGLVTFELDNTRLVEKFKNDIPREQLYDYILASACLPIFKAQKIDNKKYMDGGVMDNLPINMLANKGYKKIIAVDLHGIGITQSVTVQDIYIKSIRPTKSLGGSLEFNREKMAFNKQMGYLDTLKAFNLLQGDNYYFKPEEYLKLIGLFNSRTVSGLEIAADIYGIDKYRTYEANDFCQKIYKASVESMKESDEAKARIMNFRELAAEFDNMKKLLSKQMLLNRFINQAKSSPIQQAGNSVKGLSDYAQAAKAIIELSQFADVSDDRLSIKSDIE